MENPPTIQQKPWTFKKIIVSTLALVGILFAFWLLYRFYQVIFILFITIILGTVLRPVVFWLHKRGLSKVTSAVIVYIIMLSLVAGFLLLLFPLIFEQVTAIIQTIPDYYQRLKMLVERSPNQMINNFNQYLPDAIPEYQFTYQSDEEILKSTEMALRYISFLFKIFFFTLVTLLLSFQWVLEGQKSIQSLLFLIPKNHRKTISELISTIESKIFNYIAGQGVLCLAVGGMAFIAYLVIGLPNAFILALIAGIFEAIPMIGPTLGAIPAGVIALSESPSLLIWVIIVTVFIQFIENNILVPRIMRKALGVNPFVSLLAIFAFGSLFGLAGALMAIPLAVIIQLLLDRYVFRPDKFDKESLTGRDYSNRLRYEAQELIKDIQSQARSDKEGLNGTESQVDKVMDEIEAITINLDLLLSQISEAGQND